MKQKILVTGHSGLIGSHLLKRLIEDGDYEIFTLGRTRPKEPQVQFIQSDFSKDNFIESLPKQMDIVVHLSQSENFRLFPEKATEVFKVNTLSTALLADYAFNAGVKKFIYASSAGIYGLGNNEDYNEEQEIVYKNELGYYLATKHCSEVILENYWSLFSVVLLRFFFVYGKGQRRTMLLPRLVDNIKAKRPISLAGEEGITISLTHVSDAVNAIISSFNLSESHKINITGPENLSIKRIAEIIGNKLNTPPVYQHSYEQKPNHLMGNNAKMQKLLCLPLVEFKEGVVDIL